MLLKEKREKKKAATVRSGPAFANRNDGRPQGEAAWALRSVCKTGGGYAGSPLRYISCLFFSSFKSREETQLPLRNTPAALGSNRGQKKKTDRHTQNRSSTERPNDSTARICTAVAPPGAVPPEGWGREPERRSGMQWSDKVRRRHQSVIRKGLAWFFAGPLRLPQLGECHVNMVTLHSLEVRKGGAKTMTAGRKAGKAEVCSPERPPGGRRVQARS